MINHNKKDAGELMDRSNTSHPRNRRQRHRSSGRVKKIRNLIRQFFRINSILFIILPLIITFTISILVLLVDAGSRLESSWDNFNRILLTYEGKNGAELTLTEFTRIRVGAAELDQNIQLVQSRIGFIQPLVQLNKSWFLYSETLDISQQLVAATQHMLDGLEPTLNFLVQDDEKEAIGSQISSGERIVELLEVGQSQFMRAENTLAKAKILLDEIDITSVDTNSLLTFKDVNDLYLQLKSINSVLLSSPQILRESLGIGSQNTYLVLAQNNDEIRPSGGYISTYGWFTIQNGRIVDYDYNPTTTISPNPPDNTFLDTFEIPDWWFGFEQPIYAAWDGSWYTDFPSTAKLAMNFYNAGDNPNSPVQGVIAIDITGFELILEALGEVYVERYNEFVNKDNFRDVVYNIRTYGNDEHKEFLSAVYEEIFTNWQSVNEDSSVDLIYTLIDALTQKHIIIYLNNKEADEALDLMGWAGSQIVPNMHDYIMVVDANLGNKSDNSVNRSITYDVIIDEDQSRESHLRISYDYLASIAEQDPAVNPGYHGPINYRNLAQIYLPTNIEVIENQPNNEFSFFDLDNYSLITTQINVDYDSSTNLRLSYKTPKVNDRFGEYYRYSLLVQKQPGARTRDLNIQLRFPENAEIISVSPDADANYQLGQPILDFRRQLESDEWFEIIYRLP